MKKKDQQSVVKEQKKVAKKQLLEQIIAALNDVSANFTNNKKIKKLINKNAKQLVKKISREIKTIPSPLQAVIEPVAKTVTNPSSTKSAKKEKTPA